jgi:benzoyl-CoA reductase/2-hydroxyglutaryl-CoA dehydratase subunit BcrC/BadD/HgdB
MAGYFEELRQAAEEGKGKVAWCTSVGPAELLYSLGFKVHFPENHAAILGSTRTCMDYIPVANAAGYSPEICSYLTSDIGAYMKKETPLTKAYNFKSIPKPDVLVYNTNQCRDVQDWFSFYQREFKVPLLGVSTPRSVPELEEMHLKSVEAQLEALVEPLEKVAGTKLDKQEFKKVVGLSRQCSDLWSEVLRTGGHVPSPLSFTWARRWSSGEGRRPSTTTGSFWRSSSSVQRTASPLSKARNCASTGTGCRCGAG